MENTIQTLYAHPDCIRTYTGKFVNPLKMTDSDICIEDIAHALSLVPRFAGHTNHFLSVACHSITVCTLVSIQHKLAALLHDATEAYLLDIPTPIKKQLPLYQEAEKNLQRLIAKKFEFEYPLHPEIKAADKQALEEEYKVYHLSSDSMPPPPDWIERNFLKTFHLLTQNK